MLRVLAWIAAGCVVLILVLALLRGRGQEPARAVAPIPESPGVAQAAPQPPPRTEPAAEPPVVAATPSEADLQIQSDAAAVGMTTIPDAPGAGSGPAQTPPN